MLFASAAFYVFIKIVIVIWVINLFFVSLFLTTHCTDTTVRLAYPSSIVFSIYLTHPMTAKLRTKHYNI